MTVLPDWATQALPWLFLLALAVRFANLTYHSLWYDEVVSTFWAARPVEEIVRVGLALTQDKHPPLYYLLLRGWTALFGPGDLAVRSLGALIGGLAVLPAYGIGTRLGGRRGGIFAAGLLALNPFLVWYSQEARMFMPAATFALAGMFGLWWLVERGRPAAAALLVLGLLAALYTYLYSAFLLPAAGAWLLLLAWLNRDEPGARRRLLAGAAALAAVAILFLPLALAAWRVSGAEAVPGRAFVGMGPALANLLKVYLLGWPAWDPRLVSALAAAAGLLAAFGCLAPGPRGRYRWAGAFLVLWIGAIILAGGYLLSRDSRTFAETRYQIMLVPALCLAWGRGLARLWEWGTFSPNPSPEAKAGRIASPDPSPYAGGERTPSPEPSLEAVDRRGRGGGGADRRRLLGPAAGSLGLVFMVGVTLAALPFDWSSTNRREDWRAAAAYVAAHAGPNDAILIQADYVHIAFQRYYKSTQDVFYPFTDRLKDPAQVDGPLAGLHDFDAVWVIQSHHEELDPKNLVLNWFGARYPQITEVFPTGIAIHAYRQHYRTPALPAGVTGSPAAALGPLRLLACQYQPAALPATDTVLHPPSNWIHVTAYWALAGAAPAQDLAPRARLTDAQGQVWGEELDRPGGVFHVWPTSRWLSGEIVAADGDVNLNPITPPGAYTLEIETPGQSDKVICGRATITR